MTEGEALKVDLNTGKVTLRHRPIENLGMPGMTMMFPVPDKKTLGVIKDGDKVRFRGLNVRCRRLRTHAVDTRSGRRRPGTGRRRRTLVPQNCRGRHTGAPVTEDALDGASGGLTSMLYSSLRRR